MEAFQFHSFEVDDTLKKKTRLGGETVANTEEPAVEVADETALTHTRETPAISLLCPLGDGVEPAENWKKKEAE